MLAVSCFFVLALCLSLLLTPVAGWIGSIFGAVDSPTSRKNHTVPRPRTGGIALFSVFGLTFLLGYQLPLNIKEALWSEEILALFLGGTVVLGIGLIDDFREISYKIKFLAQIFAASCAFWGGFQIDHFHMYHLSFDFHPFLSYGITIFWFLLFVNAVNLIDGLDGLACGIVFFASTVMVILLALRQEQQSALLFAILSGAVLGFLRYNFNPAKIFLGDGGSYFLGFILASLSILGSAKSQIGAAILIPLVGMGIPVFDTMIAPIRRFFLGKELFHPDNDHIHHRLIKKGFTAQQAVWVLYIASAALCLFSLFLAQVRDQRAGILLIILGAGAVFLVKKLGYFDHLKTKNISEWIKDLSYEAGFHKDRRSFLDMQHQISEAQNLEQMWKQVTQALELFGFDVAEMELHNKSSESLKASHKLVWHKNGSNLEDLFASKSTLKLELPFLKGHRQYIGKIMLVKDVHQDMMSHYTLKRVEHLRRSITKALERMGQ